jgi:hypothetical protein
LISQSRGLGDVYKRQFYGNESTNYPKVTLNNEEIIKKWLEILK